MELEDLKLLACNFYADRVDILLKQSGHQLTSLHLEHIDELDMRALTCIAETCPSLEKLVFFRWWQRDTGYCTNIYWHMAETFLFPTTLQTAMNSKLRYFFPTFRSKLTTVRLIAQLYFGDRPPHSHFVPIFYKIGLESPKFFVGLMDHDKPEGALICRKGLLTWH